MPPRVYRWDCIYGATLLLMHWGYFPHFWHVCKNVLVNCRIEFLLAPVYKSWYACFFLGYISSTEQFWKNWKDEAKKKKTVRKNVNKQNLLNVWWDAGEESWSWTREKNINDESVSDQLNNKSLIMSLPFAFLARTSLLSLMTSFASETKLPPSLLHVYLGAKLPP